MDPVVIKLQLEVVPSEEIQHLQLRNARLQSQYEELSRLIEGLRNNYSELLCLLSHMRK